MHLRAALHAKPNAQTHVELASLLYQGGNYRAAMAQLREAIKLDGKHTEALNNLAWLLATAPDAHLRDGKEAVNYARQACVLTEFKQPHPLGTLAAAYAEAGRFPQAIRMAEKSIDLTTRSGEAQLAMISRELLKLYKQEQPYHESAKLP